MQAIPGLKLVEMDGSDRCCGSAGIYNLTHASMSQQLLKEKMQAVGATNADAIVAPNPGCMLQLRYGAAKLRTESTSVSFDGSARPRLRRGAGKAMKISTDQLAQRLSASLGGDSIMVGSTLLAEHDVDGFTPKLICTPATAEQLAAAVGIFSQAQAPSRPGVAARRWVWAIRRALSMSS